MAKFEYTHNGYVYEIEADDEKSADEKFRKSLKGFTDLENKEKTKKEQGQNKEWDDKMKGAKTPYEKVDSTLNAIFGRANRAMREAPLGLDTMEKKVNPSIVKGVPVAGRFVPQTEELTQFENEHPYTSKGLQIAGGTAATLPIMGGMSKFAGPGFLKQFASQNAVQAPINVADTAARKGAGNVTKEDVTKDLMWAAITSTIPAAITKGLGQSPRSFTPDIQKFMSPGGHKLPSGANLPPPWATQRGTQISPPFTGAINPDTLSSLSSLAGAGVGGYTGGMTGAVLGALLGQHARRAAADYAVPLMRHPSSQDILRSLAAQSHSQMQGVPPEQVSNLLPQ